MSKIQIKNISGEKVADRDLSEDVFGIEPNIPVMHQVVRAQMAAARQGTHATKSRGMVSGGGRKPWRQKGTGRARQGSIRSPQWVGGGVVFGPQPRSYAFRVNKKVINLAIRSALSAKLADEELFVIDEFKFEGPSTKAAIALLDALGIEGRVTVIVDDEDLDTYLSFRNIKRVRVIAVSDANTYDIIDNTAVLATDAVIARLEEVLA